jgi:N-methylhydantoinase B/oxoprolinase/acetone carboxylase alpha subunit
MPETASARAGALDATIAVDENAPSPEQKLKRLRADVAQCQRVVDELVEGQDRADAKARHVESVYKAKQRETEKMITAARRALKDAKAALKAEED